MKPILFPRSSRALWIKILTSVDEDAVNAYGYHGPFRTPGAVARDVAPGTVLLERSGTPKKQLHTLYQLDEDREWQEIASSDSPGWAVELNDAARDLLKK